MLDQRVKSTVGPSMDNQGSLVAGDHEMSKMFNMCFASGFTCVYRQNLPSEKAVHC